MPTHEIIGDDVQAVVVLTLANGDEVRADAGAMTYTTDGIEMDARMEGGLLGGLKRRVLGSLVGMVGRRLVALGGVRVGRRRRGPAPFPVAVYFALAEPK